MSLLVDPRFRRLARIAFWLACLFAVVMALLPKPPELPTDRLGDKVQHMIAFATLTGLAGLGFAREYRWRIAERLSFLGAMIEVAQSIPALHRDCQFADWVADTVVILGVTLVLACILPAGRKVSNTRD